MTNALQFHHAHSINLLPVNPRFAIACGACLPSHLDLFARSCRRHRLTETLKTTASPAPPWARGVSASVINAVKVLTHQPPAETARSYELGRQAQLNIYKYTRITRIDVAMAYAEIHVKRPTSPASHSPAVGVSAALWRRFVQESVPGRKYEKEKNRRETDNDTGTLPVLSEFICKPQNRVAFSIAIYDYITSVAGPRESGLRP
ncbi:hypothetical protein EVAR_99812_1 [Eumeta japonica]|uniref:Uncharacterized protein n=1 Tax=Eumeta variegata TaxID=151549 RepID=A0A4C2ADT6_EUMVA|nr:hypothetical protein EVAR_99812_1 [Eumeta japonica]